MKNSRLNKLKRERTSKELKPEPTITPLLRMLRRLLKRRRSKVFQATCQMLNSTTLESPRMNTLICLDSKLAAMISNSTVKEEREEVAVEAEVAEAPEAAVEAMRTEARDVKVETRVENSTSPKMLSQPCEHI